MASATPPANAIPFRPSVEKINHVKYFQNSLLLYQAKCYLFPFSSLSMLLRKQLADYQVLLEGKLGYTEALWNIPVIRE